MKKLFYVFSFFLIVTLQNTAIAAETTTNFTKQQIKQIEKVTHDYLVNNPQVLVEVGKKLQEQELEEQKAQIARIKIAIPKYKNKIFDTKTPGRIVLGNPQGKIILAEFTQHQCHHCKEATVLVDKLLKNHPEIQFITIYWPFFGDDAAYTAQAVLAAQKQNKAEELNQAIFAYKDTPTKDRADTIIKSIAGLDSKKLYADMTAKELESGLRENFNLAKDLELIGTPSLIFTNREMTKFSLVPGQTPTFEKDLTKALNEVQ